MTDASSAPHNELPPGLRPQDPYGSYVVTASAGTGKTFQLSRRFLFLVGAGADPGAILTVTFTKKAAGEMRQRILGEAAKLARDEKAQRSFDADLQRFRSHAQQRGDGPYGHQPAPATRPAAAVAQLILASSQLLRISTIDSLFLDLVSKFPREASDDPSTADLGVRPETIPSPFELMTRLASDQHDEHGLRDIGRELRAAWQGESDAAARWRLAIHKGAPRDLKSRFAELEQQETYLWQARRSGASPLLTHPVPLAHQRWIGRSDSDVLADLDAALRRIIAEVSNAERRSRFEEAFQARSISGWLETDFFNKSGLVNGNLVRGAKKDRLAGEIELINEAFAAIGDEARRQRLMAIGHAILDLHDRYGAARDRGKTAAGQVGFRDLVKGCHRLFHGASSAGARYLLARTVHHLLLDEFQDTSRLQWSVFEAIASQLLEGLSLDDAPLVPTVFLVGDAKQSIYGFREADPGVMELALESLGPSIAVAPLVRSYRTAQVVLDFVNHACGEAITEFPRHESAVDEQGKAIVPDHGAVLVLQELLPNLASSESTPGQAGDAAADPDDEDEDEDDADSGVEREAHVVVEVLGQALRGELGWSVADKGTGRQRPLQPRDCAVLYRGAAGASKLASALRAAGIPCQREEARGFFERQEIADQVALLRHLALPSDVRAFAVTCRSSAGGLSDAAVLALLHHRHKGDLSVPALLTAIANGELAALLPAEAAAAAELANLLLHLQGRVGHVLPHELLLEWLVARGAFAGNHATSGPESTLARRNLQRLLELVMAAEQSGLTAPLALVDHLVQLADSDETGNAAVAADAVTLMTVHKSKGLEFPLVAVVDTGRPWGRQEGRWQQEPPGSPRLGVFYLGSKTDRPSSDPHFDELLAAGSERIVEECQRLLYVALTRARQYLIVTGHQVSNRSKGIENTKPFGQLQSAAVAAGAEPITIAGQAFLKLERRQVETKVSAPASPAAKATRSPPAARGWPPPVVTSRELPREWLIRSPSRHDGNASEAPRVDHELTPLSHWDADLASAIGTYVHRGLERQLKQLAVKEVEREQWWRQLAGPQTPATMAARVEADDLLTRAKSDLSLAQLAQGAVQVYTERPVVHRRGTDLVIGTIDLWLTQADGSQLIIDYKTTRFPTAVAPTDAELTAYAHERGWVRQIAAYVAAVAAMGDTGSPVAPVRGAVYFVALSRLLWVA